MVFFKQLADALASKIDVLSSDNLVTLGQSAVGLSITQIGTINDTDVLKSLGTLGKVQGWTPGAANALVAKLMSANFQVRFNCIKRVLDTINTTNSTCPFNNTGQVILWRNITF